MRKPKELAPTEARPASKAAAAPLPDLHAELAARGEGEFRLWLRDLPVPLLRSLVQAHDFDPARRTSKWKEGEKLATFIADSLRSRMARGSAFMERNEATAGPVAKSVRPASPPGWGVDELSKFWDAARSNQFGTFVRKRPMYDRLVGIDRAFAEVSKRWTNPESEVAAMLFLRCHSAFRAASGHAAAGQAVESYIINRAGLEFAAYALHIYRNPELGVIWLNRHQGEADLQASKDAFSHRKVNATVKSVNRHAGERFEMLYQRCIDLGGHPNERSVTGNMSMVDEPDRRLMLAIFLHGDGPALDMALKTTAQCGVCSLEMLQGVFNSLFELLGVNAAILDLRKGL